MKRYILIFLFTNKIFTFYSVDIIHFWMINPNFGISYFILNKNNLSMSEKNKSINITISILSLGLITICLLINIFIKNKIYLSNNKLIDLKEEYENLIDESSIENTNKNDFPYENLIRKSIYFNKIKIIQKKYLSNTKFNNKSTIFTYIFGSDEKLIECEIRYIKIHGNSFHSTMLFYKILRINKKINTAINKFFNNINQKKLKIIQKIEHENNKIKYHEPIIEIESNNIFDITQNKLNIVEI